MAQPIINPVRSVLIAIINTQPTAEQRLDFAEIAHAHGHICDDLLATYERAAGVVA